MTGARAFSHGVLSRGSPTAFNGVLSRGSLTAFTAFTRFTQF
jgi:hypothetical protein